MGTCFICGAKTQGPVWGQTMCARCARLASERELAQVEPRLFDVLARVFPTADDYARAKSYLIHRKVVARSVSEANRLATKGYYGVHTVESMPVEGAL